MKSAVFATTKSAVIAGLASMLLSGLTLAAGSDGLDAPSVLKRDDGTAIHFYLERASGSPNSKTLLISLQGSDCNSVKYDTFIRDYSRGVWPAADLLLLEKAGITSKLPYSSDPERSDCPPPYLH